MFENQLFRCSALGKLMTNDRSGKNMGETAKTYLKELFLEIKFGIKKDVTSKYISKGLMAEESAIALYSFIKNGFYTKNDEWFKNDFISGTPDIIEKDFLVDIKTSWDASTFPFFDAELPNKAYYYQVQGYMWLTGLNKASVSYCLVDTPDQLIEDEKRRLAWKMGLIDDINQDYLDACLDIDKNHTFGQFPKEMRIKEFTIERDEDVINAIKSRCIEARMFLISINNG